ncbi:MAG TPA: LysR family transcriptional regulator [Chloroflexota bacterium]|jgi:molybdate transport system regulatory protein
MMLRPRCKIWLESDAGEVALSDWRVQLLEAVDQHGSLAEAARQLAVPYKTAWYKLKDMEATIGVALLLTSSGGKGHGGASLTEAGQEAVRRYHAIVDGLDGEVRERFDAEFAVPLPPVLRGRRAERLAEGT